MADRDLEVKDRDDLLVAAHDLEAKDRVAPAVAADDVQEAPAMALTQPCVTAHRTGAMEDGAPAMALTQPCVTAHRTGAMEDGAPAMASNALPMAAHGFKASDQDAPPVVLTEPGRALGMMAPTPCHTMARDAEAGEHHAPGAEAKPITANVSKATQKALRLEKIKELQRQRKEKREALQAKSDNIAPLTPVESESDDTENNRQDCSVTATSEFEIDPAASLKNLCECMDSRGLKRFIQRHRKKIRNLSSYLIPALECASDPVLLALEALEPKTNHRVAYIVLDCLFRHLYKPSVAGNRSYNDNMKGRAAEIAKRLKQDMAHFGRCTIEKICPSVAWSLLQLLAIFGLNYTYKKIQNLVCITASTHLDLAPTVFRALRLNRKAKGFVQYLLRRKKKKEAIYFAHEFGILDEIPQRLRPVCSELFNKLQSERNNQQKDWVMRFEGSDAPGTNSQNASSQVASIPDEDASAQVTDKSDIDPLFVFTSLKEFCERMDSDGLKCFIVSYWKKVPDLHRQLIPALLCAADPFLLVLNAVDLTPSRNAAFIALDCLFRLLSNPSVKAKHHCNEDMKMRAREIAEKFKRHMTFNSRRNPTERISPVVAWSFLQLLAIFGIASNYSHKELCALVLVTAKRKLAPTVCRAVGLCAKANGIVDNLVRSNKVAEAVCFAHEFGIMDRIPRKLLTPELLKVGKLQQEKMDQFEDANETAVISSEFFNSNNASRPANVYGQGFESSVDINPSNDLEKVTHGRPIPLQNISAMRLQGGGPPGVGAGRGFTLPTGPATVYEDQAKRPRLSNNSGIDAGMYTAHTFASRSSNPSGAMNYRGLYPCPPIYQDGNVSYSVSRANCIDRNLGAGYPLVAEAGYPSVFGASGGPVPLSNTHLHHSDGIGSSVPSSSIYSNPYAGSSSGLGLPSYYGYHPFMK